MSVRLHKLTISKRVHETNDSVSLQIKVPDELKETFRYKQGQFLAVQIDIDGEKFRREYSLSSSPYYDEPLEISAKVVPGGKVSPYVFRRLLVGDSIEAFPPQGKFFTELDPCNKKTYVLIGGGSGITPLISIIRSVLKVEPDSKCILYYGNYDEKSIIFKDRLIELEQAGNGSLKNYYTVEYPPKEWTGLIGMINKTDLKKIIEDESADSSDTEYFICGPTPMMPLVEKSLLEMNVDKNRIHIEYFTAPVAEISEAKVENDEGEIEVEETILGEHKVKIILDGEETIITVKPDQRILDAAFDAGLDPPFSCRSGICSTCRAKLLSGQVKMDEREGLSDSEIEEGFILTCQSHPLTDDTVVEYD